MTKHIENTGHPQYLEDEATTLSVEDAQTLIPSIHANTHEWHDEDNRKHEHNKDNATTNGDLREDVGISIVTKKDSKTQD